MSYRGRFAPSPTGPLHFGSLISAVSSYLQAKTQQGIWLVRIEDIDPPREVTGSKDSILRTLERHQLYWDESVSYQSQHSDRYVSALDQLADKSLLFQCQCSRKTVSEAQQRLGISVYPGTCRQRQIEDSATTATRVLVADKEISFFDRIQGQFTQDLSRDVGDFVLRRADGLFAYQLAVVVDDAFQNITEVVRGSDLLDNTPRQMLLQSYLGLTTPDYVHHPIATNTQGEKLSKQTFAQPIDDTPPIQNLTKALDFLGQNPPNESQFGSLEELWDWAINNWNIDKIQRQQSISVIE